MKNKKQKKNRNNKMMKENLINSNQIIIEQKSMTDAIVRAHEIIEEKKMEKKIEIEKIEKQEWQQIMGQKEYPQNEKWYLKGIHDLRNEWVGIGKLFFFDAKNARDLRATFALMKFALNVIFRLCKWCLYILAIAFVVSVFQNGMGSLLNLAIAFAIWGLARLFRIASFEVEEIKDGNLLISLFSGCISFVAMVIAIITIFVK